jgi:pimeloyl-ACP methyl ester carboxylesterase
MWKFLIFLATHAHGITTPLSTYNFTWNVSNDTLQLSLDVQTEGWVGFAISSGTGMRGSDYMRVDGDGNIEDGYSLDLPSRGMPQPDCQQDWTLVSREVVNGKTKLVVQRKFDTGDAQDHKIVDDGLGHYVLVAHAHQNTKSFAYHMPTNRAQVQVNFFRGTSNEEQIAELEANSEVLQFEVKMHAPGDANSPYTVPAPGNSDAVTNLIDSCQDLPSSIVTDPSGAHVLAMQAKVQTGNEALVHHYVIYGMRQTCEELGCTGSICDGGETNAGNAVTLWAWQIGGPDFILPSDIGFPIGGNSGIKAIVMNVHYDNPSMTQGLTDSSSTVLHYTTTQKRPYDMGVLWTGDPTVSLGGEPVMADTYSKEALYVFNCPATYLEPLAGKIKIIGALMHMHRAGDFMETKQIGWMGNTKAVWRTELYDGNFQTLNSFNQSVELEAGDRLVTSCVFSNDLKAANKDILRFGSQGDEEMCIDFLYYYSPISNDVVSQENARTGLCLDMTADRRQKHTRMPLNDTRKVMHIEFGQPPMGKDWSCNDVAVTPAPTVTYKKYNVTGPDGLQTELSVGQMGADNAEITVVALHGFPQGSYMWFPDFAPELIQKLGSAKVIAPDMRGFNRTSKHPCSAVGCEAYQPTVIAGEIAILLETHFNAKAKPVQLVGHDWGAAIAWLVAIHHKELIHTLSVVSVPHPSVFKQFLKNDPLQNQSSQYARDWAYAPSSSYAGMKPSQQNSLFQMMGMNGAADQEMEYIYNEAWLYEESLKFALNMYVGSAGFDLVDAGINSSNMVVAVPTLQMWGSDDTSLRTAMICCDKNVVENLHVKVFEQRGHWVIDSDGKEVAMAVGDLIQCNMANTSASCTLDMNKCTNVAPYCSKDREAICNMDTPVDLPSTTCDTSGYPDKAVGDMRAIDPSCDLCSGQSSNSGMWQDTATNKDDEGNEYGCGNMRAYCQTEEDQCSWGQGTCTQFAGFFSPSPCCGGKAENIEELLACPLCGDSNLVFDGTVLIEGHQLGSCQGLKDCTSSAEALRYCEISTLTCQEAQAFVMQKSCCVPGPTPAPAPTSSAIPTPAGASTKVRSTLVLSNMDYNKLDAAAKTKVEDQVRNTYLTHLQGYTADQIEVTLSAGSVRATVDIQPKTGDTVASLQTEVGAKEDVLKTSAVTNLQAMPEIDSLMEDGKTASELSATVEAPTAVTTSATTPVIPEASAASKGFSAGMQALVLFAVTSFSMLLLQ